MSIIQRCPNVGPTLAQRIQGVMEPMLAQRWPNFGSYLYN